MTGQVTALGIRDGDPAVLNALVDRRGAAVVAYCERACAPGLATEAAADAFARFRATVIATERPTDLDPEAALLAATRVSAADRAPEPAGTGAGPLGRMLGGKAPENIAEVPALLVARADGSLDPASEDRLNRLLDASAAARAAEERFHAAEYAYRTAVARPLPPPVKQQVLMTMGAIAVPTNGAAHDEPVAPAPLAEEPVAQEPVIEEPEPIAETEPVTVDEPVPDPEPVQDPEPEPEPVAAEEPLAEEEPVVEEEPVIEEHDPSATVEWTLPEEEEPVESAAPPPPPPPLPPPPLRQDPPTTALPRVVAERPGFPGRSAFAPAAAVVAVAAIGALVASGAFGGNDATPQLDTGIVRPRAVNAIPEGEAKSVIGDLRDSAAQARRQRLADKQRQIAAQAPPTAPAPAPEEEDAQEDEAATPQEQPAPEAQQQDERQAPADEPDNGTGGAAEEQPSGTADDPEVDGSVPDGTP